jgi:hypothetical protein
MDKVLHLATPLKKEKSKFKTLEKHHLKKITIFIAETPPTTTINY